MARDKFGMRIFARIFAAAAALFLAAAELSGADGPPDLKYGTRIVCAGEFPGHLQGLAADGKAIYWVFTRGIVKTDFSGRVLAKRAMPYHAGDPCWHDGKLYVPVCSSGFNRKLKPGAASRNHVHVFDAELKPLGKHHIPELEYGAGGIGVRDGRFFVVGGRPKDLPGNTVYEYDGNFKPVRSHEVEFDSTAGIQAIGFAFGKWYFGCYGTGGFTIETDENFRVLRRVRPNTALGMIPLQKGRILVGQVIDKASGKGAAARVMRFTAPSAAKTPAKNSDRDKKK